MSLEQEVFDSMASFSLRRRLLLHEFNKDLRDSLSSFLVDWMVENPDVEEIGIEMVEEFDEYGNGWSGLEIHLHSENQEIESELKDTFVEFIRSNVLDSNFEMIASAMSEPLWISKVEDKEDEAPLE